MMHVTKCSPLLLETRQQREVTAKVPTVRYTNYYNLVRALTEMIDVYRLFLSLLLRLKCLYLLWVPCYIHVWTV
jgi:hypothetical protein